MADRLVKQIAQDLPDSSWNLMQGYLWGMLQVRGVHEAYWSYLRTKTPFVSQVTSEYTIHQCLYYPRCLPLWERKKMACNDRSWRMGGRWSARYIPAIGGQRRKNEMLSMSTTYEFRSHTYDPKLTLCGPHP